MTTDRGVPMTAPAPSPEEQSVIDRFDIFAEERVVEEVARALWVAECGSDHDEVGWGAWADTYRTLAAAAVAAYRAQDDGAEEAVRRVEALAEEDERCVPILRIYATAAETADQRTYWNVMADVREQSAARIRDALAPQAER